MLQQTTTQTVVPYFNRFIQRFPNIFELAQADLESVLQVWQGLGYYRRAQHLSHSAKNIASNHDGAIPQTECDLLALKGIGKYTAKAILAIAFNHSALPIDGNVKRILSRYFSIESPYESLDKAIEEISINWDFQGASGEFCQGLMDLANTYCSSKNPLCEHCPLNADCIAFKQSKTHILPLRKIKIKHHKLHTNSFLILKNNEVLLHKHPSHTLLGSLWNVPLSKFTATSDGGHVLEHKFTHINLKISISFEETIESTALEFMPEEKMWVPLDQLDKIPISNLSRKILEKSMIMSNTKTS